MKKERASIYAFKRHDGKFKIGFTRRSPELRLREHANHRTILNDSVVIVHRLQGYAKRAETQILNDKLISPARSKRLTERRTENLDNTKVKWEDVLDVIQRVCDGTGKHQINRKVQYRITYKGESFTQVDLESDESESTHSS